MKKGGMKLYHNVIQDTFYSPHERPENVLRVRCTTCHDHIIRHPKYSESQWRHYVAQFKAAHPNSIVDKCRGLDG